MLFMLCLNLIFFHLDQTIVWDLKKSINAFAADILVRACSILDMKTVYEGFDGPARELGLDMNLAKTELHGLHRSEHTVLLSRHEGILSTRKEDGSPHEVYKELGVYFYTNDHEHQVLQYIRTTIHAFYAQLAPLSSTASELIMLTNKQLIPTLAYRLLAGPVTSERLYALQQSIWHSISKYGQLPRLPLRKDRHTHLKLVPLQTFMHPQIHSFSMRYLGGEGPPQTNYYIHQALTSPKPNWLQVTLVDATNAFGGRCHGYGPPNPCLLKTLFRSEEIHVEFKTGWLTRCVLHYEKTANATLIKFHVDSATVHVKDKLHTLSLHPRPQRQPAPPLVGQHFTLSHVLLTVPCPLPPYLFPYSSQYVDSNLFGHIYRYPGDPPRLQV